MGGEISTNHVCRFPTTFTKEFAANLNESAWLNPDNEIYCTSTYSEFFGSTWGLSNIVFYFLYYFLYPVLLFLKITDLKAVAVTQRKHMMDLPQFPVLSFTTIMASFQAIAAFDVYGLKGVYSFDTYLIIGEVRNIALALIGFAVIDFLTSTTQMKIDSLYSKKTWYYKLTFVLTPSYGVPLAIALSDKKKRFNTVMGMRRCCEALLVCTILFLSVRRKRQLLKELRNSASVSKSVQEADRIAKASKRISQSFFKYHVTVCVLIALCSLLALQGLEKFGQPLTMDPRDPGLLTSSITGILVLTFRVKSQAKRIMAFSKVMSMAKTIQSH
eukprot:snap_masked-scaffold_15-processed-gene-8.37-mRNA-1 protein AED:1.00 eAED:1.00 QI:0/0/0/0/1/1/2/0/328